MELEETINNLQEYIDLDRKMRISPIEEWSDFDKFCELHCRHIEKALHYIKEESISKAMVREKIKEVRQLENVSIADIMESQKEFCIDVLQEILNKGEK